jgi:hypothetical protein
LEKNLFSCFFSCLFYEEAWNTLSMLVTI